MNVIVAGVNMRVFDVYVHVNSGDLELIDTVYFESNWESESVRLQLIDMGYDTTICVVEHVEGGPLD
jgi:hypothetical protein